MDDIEKIKERLKDRMLSVVAKKSGVSAGALYKFMSGEVIRPSYTTVKKLQEYLDNNS